MIVGERHRPPDPTASQSPWLFPDDPTDKIFSPYSPDRLHDLIANLKLYGSDDQEGAGNPAEECDEFRMYEFKVRRCGHGRAHDWTECPYAHPGEKARRRDPRQHHYSAVSCPEFRRGCCRQGDSCEFSHGVFECWLHPSRYRTQPCKDGTDCRRRVCFFAHTPQQLRLVTTGQHSPTSLKVTPFAKMLPFLASPSTISPEESPPISPLARSLEPRASLVSEMVLSPRNLQLDRVKSLPRSYNFSGSSYGSPRGSVLRPVFQSLPSTPTGSKALPGCTECWETGSEDELAMERVMSGKSLRAEMFKKLSRENSLGPATFPGPSPDVGWVSELVK